jgi:hypothetical protein
MPPEYINKKPRFDIPKINEAGEDVYDPCKGSELISNIVRNERKKHTDRLNAKLKTLSP